ncbi:MAG: ammonium transporter, partial [Thermodesulfobacteriota bacterium]
LGTIMQSFCALGIITLLWFLIGYTLAFGSDVGGIIGNLKHLGLNGVTTAPEPSLAGTIPHSLFMIFQCMFAVLTVALISGAYAERMKFSSFLVFSVFWSLLVYSPLCHWVWGGGWLDGIGALDFAGGAVVHMSSGSAALAAALVLGRRKGHGSTAFIPHNLPMTVTGASILWLGWFGFNAGSALQVDGIAVNAFVVTHAAACMGLLGWLAGEKLHRQKPTTLGATSGAVAGLVAITPAAGFVGPLSSLFIGFLAGIICYGGVLLKEKLQFDDSLDVVAIHGLGGVWGALATGIFASTVINSGGANGLLFGNPMQLWIQFVSVVAACVFSFLVSVLILKAVDKLIGLRVTPEEEEQGLDLSMHSETGYKY